MDLLNLTLGEFLAIWLPLSGILVALYFYDRTRRRQKVSTLRFWPQRSAAPRAARRKKLQQPLSLLLHLLAVLLLLLAIADWRFAGDGAGPRHHVLVLETSAWMNVRTPQGGTLMDTARRQALAYLEAVPATDRIMVIRAGGAPALATPFTADRAQVRRAIRDSSPDWNAADLAGALDLARSSLRLAAAESGDLHRSESVGEVTFVGSGRLTEAERVRVRTAGIPFFRFIPVRKEARDTGIRRFAAQRLPEDPEQWQVTAEVYNYGASAVAPSVSFYFEGRALGNRQLQMAPGQNQEVVFSMRTPRAGTLEARLDLEDDFPGNNRALLEAPGMTRQRIEVVSSRPAQLRPLLDSLPSLEPFFHEPNQPLAQPTALRLFDRFVPPEAPSALYLDPPELKSPWPVQRVVRDVRITRWAPDHPLTEGLRTRDVWLARASIFETDAGDVSIAETDAGPVIVARSGPGGKQVIYGFDPLAVGLAHQLVTPLLFANALRWLSPYVFQGMEIRAGPPGVVETEIATSRMEEVRISSPENPNLPWSLTGGRLRFFAGRPGTVTLNTPGEQTQFSLMLPEVGKTVWTPPAGTLRGVPPPLQSTPLGAMELWPWLALAALAALALEWRLYGRRPTIPRAPASAPSEGEMPPPPLSSREAPQKGARVFEEGVRR